MTPQEKRMTISKETLVPLGMVVALCGGVVWISNQLSSIHNKLELLEASLEEQWTKRDMENWGLKLKLEKFLYVLILIKLMKIWD